MSRRILVTGGAGFIGSHVADAFLAAGDEVVVLDDLSRGSEANVPAGAEFLRLDIRSPEAAALVRERRFDVVGHLAAQIDVRKSVADPRFDADVNIGGTLNLLEAVRESGAATRFLFASTGGALYGDAAIPPTPETAAKNPESPYGIAKLGVEYYLAYYARIHGLDTAALRFGNVYGPRQDPHGEAGVVAIFCGRVLAGQPLRIFGDGTQTRDYIYVGDVAGAFVRAAAAGLPAPDSVDARSFNVGTAVETSVNELASELNRVAGTSAPVEYAPARPGEQQRSAILTEKAERLLGWRAGVPLADGLKRTYEYFASRHTVPA